MGIKELFAKINPLKNNPVTAVADASGKVADAVDGVVASASRMAQASKRQSTDMMSDNKFSKNIRPIVMTWAIAMFTMMVILDYLGHPIAGGYQSTINLILGLAVGFYFPGRTLEKLRKSKQSASAENSNN